MMLKEAVELIKDRLEGSYDKQEEEALRSLIDYVEQGKGLDKIAVADWLRKHFNPNPTPETISELAQDFCSKFSTSRKKIRLPERKGKNGYHDLDKSYERGYNACIDKFKRLNPEIGGEENG